LTNVHPNYLANPNKINIFGMRTHFKDIRKAADKTGVVYTLL
jgi:hypothetical protein